MNLPADRNRWPAPWRELFEERAGIIEFMSNLSRSTAEFRAEQDVRKLAAREPITQKDMPPANYKAQFS